MYASCVKSSFAYGSEIRPLIADVGFKFEKKQWYLHERQKVSVEISPLLSLFSATSVSSY